MSHRTPIEKEHAEFACKYCAAEEARRKRPNFRVQYGMLILAGAMMALGVAVELAGISPHAHYALFILSMLAAGYQVIPRGIRGASKAHLDINFLMTVAAFGAILIGAPAEGASVMLLFSLAELLEVRVNYRVKRDIQTLLELEPAEVSRKTPEGEERVHPDDVRVGETVCVRPGERIGLDGVVTEGSGLVDQSAITGESIPVAKAPGDPVYTGTLNQEGYFEFRVSSSPEGTVLSRIVSLVESARDSRSRTEGTIIRFSHVYTPLVVAAAVVLTAIWFILTWSPESAVYRGLTLLVTACPCALVISIPVTMVSAMSSAARNGVLIKGSTYIETLSKIRYAAFDKTGTLTEGRLQVVDICMHSTHSQQELLRAAASLESKSEHPISRAIIAAAHAGDLGLAEATDITTIAGRGIEGYFEGSRYQVGRLQTRDAGSASDEHDEHSCGQGTHVSVVRDGTDMGTIVLSDTPRVQSRQALARLSEMGIETLMLTGDNGIAAEMIAREVGVSQYAAELLPHEKVDVIRRLSLKGPTMMVGDGVNDAPALAAADVGIAMGAIAADVALETADVALMNDDLSRLPYLISLSRRAMRIARENVTVSLIVKAVVALLAVIGASTLWLAIGVGDMGLTLVVVANALRLTRALEESSHIRPQSQDGCK
ncbi:MAG: cadmium-translocating P-type ATPase [Candidatus Thorarchaeota archaeon]|nr:cadmium-translocating P-type ATPase [Candidatus Thorarchaeota archaeon]